MVTRQVNRGEAKAHLSELVAQAAAGEPVCIMHRGKPVAQLTALDVRRKRIDSSALQAITDTMPVQPGSARDFVRGMRDGEHSRYIIAGCGLDPYFLKRFHTGNGRKPPRRQP
jgi:prevent-host-death family protein